MEKILNEIENQLLRIENIQLSNYLIQMNLLKQINKNLITLADQQQKKKVKFRLFK